MKNSRDMAGFKNLSRRRFLEFCGLAGLAGLARAGLGAAPAPFFGASTSAAAPQPDPLHEALFGEQLPDGRARCQLCPHRCEVADGATTRCRSRINRQGRLYSLNYGKVCVTSADPLARNPLFHVEPGVAALGLAAAGCNLACTCCQNCDISQADPGKFPATYFAPEKITQLAQNRRLPWLTFSYSDPVAWYDYARDLARRAQQEKLKVAIATAGYIHAEPLAELAQYAQAFSVSIKGCSPESYRAITGGDWENAWATIALLAKRKSWLEVALLLVPGADDPAGVRAIARRLAQINPDIPLHLPRFMPAYKMKTQPPAPLHTLEAARQAALDEGLHFVYIHVAGHPAANTFCPDCKTQVITRNGFQIVKNGLLGDQCPHCHRALPGLWQNALANGGAA